MVDEMTVESRELALYTINTGEIYRQYTTAVIANLAKKKHKGVYDAELAVKAFERIAEIGAKQYHKEFGSTGFPWYKMFTPESRELAALEMLEHYMDEITEQSKQ